jgi:mannose-6-phosphate isomerase-like protein (cupin superfamily)
VTLLHLTVQTCGYSSASPVAYWAHFELGPNETSVAIVHGTVEEIWYFLKERGEMWRRLGEHDEIVDVGIGVCITIPVGTEFQFRSFGYEALAAIGATIPPWPGSGEATLVDGRWEPTVAPGPT